MTNGAIVLEGGALRGVYTSGVLDILIQNAIEFSCVIGVSAGSLNGINYIAGQYGRSAAVNLNFIDDKRYLDLRRAALGKSAFDFSFMFGDQLELIPFDKKRFEESECRFIAVATDVKNGEAVYFEKGKCSDIFKACIASSSIPLIAPIVELDGLSLFDGGFADPIPVDKAIAEGYDKVVVVLTRDATYRNPPPNPALRGLYRVICRLYPGLAQDIEHESDFYNSLIDHIAELEKAGRIFVIRPSEPITISRIERNSERLAELYRLGKKDAEERLPELLDYLRLD